MDIDIDQLSLEMLAMTVRLALADKALAAADHLANRYTLDCEPPLAVDDPLPAYDEARKEYLSTLPKTISISVPVAEGESQRVKADP